MEDTLMEVKPMLDKIPFNGALPELVLLPKHHKHLMFKNKIISKIPPSIVWGRFSFLTSEFISSILAVSGGLVLRLWMINNPKMLIADWLYWAWKCILICQMRFALPWPTFLILFTEVHQGEFYPFMAWYINLSVSVAPLLAQKQVTNL